MQAVNLFPPYVIYLESKTALYFGLFSAFSKLYSILKPIEIKCVFGKIGSYNVVLTYLFPFFKRHRVSLGSPGSPGTKSVDQPDLELKDMPPCGFQMLVLISWCHPIKLVFLFKAKRSLFSNLTLRFKLLIYAARKIEHSEYKDLSPLWKGGSPK